MTNTSPTVPSPAPAPAPAAEKQPKPMPKITPSTQSYETTVRDAEFKVKRSLELVTSNIQRHSDLLKRMSSKRLTRSTLQFTTADDSLMNPKLYIKC